MTDEKDDELRLISSESGKLLDSISEIQLEAITTRPTPRRNQLATKDIAGDLFGNIHDGTATKLWLLVRWDYMQGLIEGGFVAFVFGAVVGLGMDGAWPYQLLRSRQCPLHFFLRTPTKKDVLREFSLGGIREQAKNPSLT